MSIYLELYDENSEKDPLESIISLYDKLVRDVQLAINAIEKNDLKQKSELVSRILLILDVMKACLNQQEGGMAASQLSIFYQNLELKITQANLKKSIHLFQCIQRDVSMVQSAWRNIASVSSIS